MPLNAFLRIGEEFEAIANHDPHPLVRAELRDGSELDAEDVKGLRQELATESAADIIQITIGIGRTATAQTWLNWDKARGEMRLRSEGQDEPKVHGTYGPVMRRVEGRLEAIDRGETDDEGALANANPVADSHVTIGSITASSVAVSGSGSATSAYSSDGPSPQPRSHWWRQTWVTVVAPTVVLVAAGIILALLLGH
jgi:hypothetical protein